MGVVPPDFPDDDSAAAFFPSGVLVFRSPFLPGSLPSFSFSLFDSLFPSLWISLSLLRPSPVSNSESSRPAFGSLGSVASRALDFPNNYLKSAALSAFLSPPAFFHGVALYPFCSLNPSSALSVRHHIRSDVWRRLLCMARWAVAEVAWRW